MKSCKRLCLGNKRLTEAQIIIEIHFILHLVVIMSHLLEIIIRNLFTFQSYPLFPALGSNVHPSFWWSLRSCNPWFMARFTRFPTPLSPKGAERHNGARMMIIFPSFCWDFFWSRKFRLFLLSLQKAFGRREKWTRMKGQLENNHSLQSSSQPVGRCRKVKQNYEWRDVGQERDEVNGSE